MKGEEGVGIMLMLFFTLMLPTTRSSAVPDFAFLHSLSLFSEFLCLFSSLNPCLRTGASKAEPRCAACCFALQPLAYTYSANKFTVS